MMTLFLQMELNSCLKCDKELFCSAEVTRTQEAWAGVRYYPDGSGQPPEGAEYELEDGTLEVWEYFLPKDPFGHYKRMEQRMNATLLGERVTVTCKDCLAKARGWILDHADEEFEKNE